MIAFLSRCLSVALEICQTASAGLALMIVLSLIAGRRGNGRFLLYGNRVCLNLCLILALAGIFYFPLAYFREIVSFNQDAAIIWKPFLEPPGLPWSTSMGAQVAGFLLLGAGRLLLPNRLGDSYLLRDVKGTLFCCLAAAFCLGATCFLSDWPFAGYPPELSGERVFRAVFRNAAGHYFRDFCPAGALGALLALCLPARPEIYSRKEKILACRWMCAWAFAGNLPWLLRAWAVLIGVSLRGNPAAFGPGYLTSHLFVLGILSFALALWLCQTLSKKLLPWAIAGAMALFVSFKWIP